MNTLQDLFAYNSWANAQVFSVCRGVDRARLEAQETGTFGTIEGTLAHLVGVEDVYLRALRDESLAAGESREAYFAHDLTWFADRSAQVGAEYQELLKNANDDFLAAPLRIPWLDFALTKHDGLLQVLSHSAQHRAQVFSTLGERGIKVPDLDYVVFIRSGAA